MYFSLGLGYKQIGCAFLNFMKGNNGRLFNVPSIKCLDKVLSEKTGIEERQSRPGFLPAMIREAKADFGKRPVFLALDERTVMIQ